MAYRFMLHGDKVSKNFTKKAKPWQILCDVRIVIPYQLARVAKENQLPLLIFDILQKNKSKRQNVWQAVANAL